MIFELVLAILTAYNKTLDLIMSVRADMPEAERRREWEQHFARVRFWDGLVEQAFGKLFAGLNPKPEDKP